MKTIDGFKKLSTPLIEGTEHTEDYEVVFLDGICLLTGTVDMCNFFQCMEKKHNCTVNAVYKTVHSLYKTEIKELYQYLIINDGETLELAIDEVFRIKSSLKEDDEDTLSTALKIKSHVDSHHITVELIRSLLKIIED